MIEFVEIVKNTNAYRLFERGFKGRACSHAFIVESDDTLLSDSFVSLCASIVMCGRGGCLECTACKKVANRNHPDVLRLPEGKQMSVADVRRIISECSLHTYEGGARVVIINCSGIGDEWQNKLLKILEEPPPDTYFFLTAPSADRLLATVASRCQLLYLSNGDPRLVRDELVGRGIGGSEAARAAELSAGNVTRALGCLSEGYRELSAVVYGFFTTVKNSKQALPYAQRLISYKSEASDVLDMMTSVLYGALRAHSGIGDVSDELTQICAEYSREACVYSIERINDAKRRLSAYAGYPAVMDNLIMQILEVKYRCRK